MQEVFRTSYSGILHEWNEDVQELELVKVFIQIFYGLALIQLPNFFQYFSYRIAIGH
jgi:hypothetical protein